MKECREVTTHELETRSDGNLEIHEIMLSIKTADTSSAGTNANAFLQIGDKVFLLDDSSGQEVRLGEKGSFTKLAAVAPVVAQDERPARIRGCFSLNVGGVALTKQTKEDGSSSLSVTVGGLPFSSELFDKAAQGEGSSGPVELPVGHAESALQNIKTDEFERGQLDVFFLKAGLSLDNLRGAQITLFHDKRGVASDWHIWQIELTVRYEGKSSFLLYKKWNAVGWLNDDSPIVVLQ